MKRVSKTPRPGRQSRQDKKPVNGQKPTSPTTETPASQKNEVRLNKYMANSGLCSRREADKLILTGSVTVNGRKVTELGTKITPGDEVKFKGRKLIPEKNVYILMNKPKDVITSTEDPQGRKTIFSIIRSKPDERIYPVGRLDRMTTGVLLLTNDGDLTKKLTHPKYQKKKIYQVSLNKNLNRKDMEKIAEGITLDDGLIQSDSISYVDPDDKREIGIEIHSGRNRIIRRIFESLDYRVEKLDRVYFAGLTKKGLTRGKWRYLTDKEISVLKRGSYK
ncbi:MAG: rRNA pseudouridine synthase [Bacteroidetes bacterium]|nr:MAG: rRNA pseudouridine synthase [Bacteroidota bacterium]